jgi:hypothetical protein
VNSGPVNVVEIGIRSSFEVVNDGL